MNRVILMGRLTRDPEVRYTQGERSMAVARYTLAVDRRGARKSQDGNEQTADLLISWHLTEQVSLQRSIFVRGCVYWCPDASRTGSYTNKEGQRVYTTDIIVDDQEFADSKNSAGGNGDNGSYGYQPTSRPAPTSAIGDGFMNIPDGVEDEGLPFN